MRRGTKAFFAASMIAQVAALLRYVILARMLGPHELGLAATLILTSQFFESVSDTGANRFIVQDSRGDTKTMQGVVQLTLAGRGVFIAVALALTADLAARMYQAPMLAPALIALGLAPLINGLQNLDFKRLQRDGDFRPEAYTTIFGEVIGAVVTATAAWIVRDHTAVIYGLVARASVMVLVSHVTAKRLYGWSIDRQDALSFSRFAAPLFLNGLLLFFGSQGDRLIVGSTLGPEGLGRYSAILLLVFYPAAAISRFVMGIHLPGMAAARDDPERFARQRDRLGARTLLLGTAILVGFSIVGPVLSPLLYGHKFAQALPLFAILGLLQGTRLLRFWPNTVAVAVGDSLAVLINNIVRVVALPIALVAVHFWPSIYSICAGFVFGELLALLTAILLLARKRAVDIGPELRRCILFTLVGAGVVACSAMFETRNWALAGVTAFASLVLLAAVAWTERAALDEAWGMARARLFKRKAAA